MACLCPVGLRSRAGRVSRQKAAVKLAFVGPNTWAKWGDIIFPKGSLTVVVFRADVSSLTGFDSYPTPQSLHSLLPERG